MRTVLLLVAITLLWNGGVQAFKDKEFKTCKDAGFCRRNRGVSFKAYRIEPSSVQAAGPSVSGVLVNDKAPGGSKAFAWSLVAHAGGFARLQVDESPSVGRYRINDILEADAQAAKADWHQLGGDARGSIFASGRLSVAITYEPFRMAFSIDGKPAVNLNSRDMFQFEHRRSKEVSPPETCDGCWEETFLSHRDSKPYGPEAISLDISFPGFDHVYGIPEHAASHALKTTAQLGGEPYRLYNLDVFEYALDHPFGLYGSIPLMLAHRVGLTTGVFWLNAAEMYVDLVKESGGMASQWIAESATYNPGTASRDLPRLCAQVGIMDVLKWGSKCRWNYKDEADVTGVSARFDDNEMPMDVMWLDLDHTNGKRYMTWDQKHFPTPHLMQEDLGARGRKLVTIIDPHVKRERSYPMFTEAEAQGFYVKNRDGRDFDA
ncbi:glycosyl hydrolases family 31-domain-containing protein [Dunaliella salina]|uniref:Glucosidase II subunit alpha n=1 Tax=Dunaliella salina TaxID=3046 RepID=A0ABQ7GJC1_DUNSA|nr:glycosyl hydrolases family 31-domain-containing protein [Dunaliella salina]|eukprot:KAF5834710.1 glycosyl hydrolases family 31-domain-containing protein [Dunaliella salina]